MRLLDRPFRIEGQPGIDLGRDSARDDLQDLLAERDGEAIDDRVDLRVGISGLRLGRFHHLVEQFAIPRHLGSFEEQ